MKQRKLKSQ